MKYLIVNSFTGHTIRKLIDVECGEKVSENHCTTFLWGIENALMAN